MSDPYSNNPYQPPQSSVGYADPNNLPLASPLIRLGAAIIDGIILWPIGYILGKIFISTPSQEEAVEMVRKYGQQGAIDRLTPGMPTMLLISLIGLIVFIAINFVFLKKGQTIAKMLLKIQVQNRQTSGLLSIQDIILKRILPVQAISLMASTVHWSLGLIIIADALCIFRPGRNTLHDDIANTKVVQLQG